MQTPIPFGLKLNVTVSAGLHLRERLDVSVVNRDGTIPELTPEIDSFVKDWVRRHGRKPTLVEVHGSNKETMARVPLSTSHITYRPPVKKNEPAPEPETVLEAA